MSTVSLGSLNRNVAQKWNSSQRIISLENYKQIRIKVHQQDHGIMRVPQGDIRLRNSWEYELVRLSKNPFGKWISIYNSTIPLEMEWQNKRRPEQPFIRWWAAFLGNASSSHLLNAGNALCINHVGQEWKGSECWGHLVLCGCSYTWAQSGDPHPLS
jgi:hypothetical protein